ncbi:MULTISPECIES: rhodanese-like domain-containing protein [unclassified Paenibacillus]|uniref:rhodanese-like domain-containing protein n=1 Tax=unclassified Paenibacillus TaxID=185978 RepID=UPI000839C283|nr:rhodanese-like domain-containing protein [Paenibacillus sp. GM2]NWL89885.1 rhodanese-like domain-containing protein [Paenibacillus sp. 79R4]
MSEIIGGVSHIDCDELQHILQNSNNKTLVIDVREPEEYIAGHIPGIPLIPMNEIPDYIGDFDMDREYVFVCRSGGRSYQVARYFQQNGFDKVHNYSGGMLEWDYDIAEGPENIIQEFDPARLERK